MSWRPKPLRPTDPPTVPELEELRRYLMGAGMDRLGSTTAGFLLRLCRMDPAGRFRAAMDQVIRMMHEQSTRTNELTRLLTEDEFTAYNQVAQSNMKADVKYTVERLLCLEDRHIMSSFLRNTFNRLRIHNNTKLK